MRTVVCVAALLAAMLCVVVASPSDQCSLCSRVIEKVYGAIDEDDGGKLDAVLDTVCTTFNNATLSQLCSSLLDDENMASLLASHAPTPDVCIAAHMCEQPLIPPPSAPVEVKSDEDSDAFHTAGKDDTVAQLLQREREETEQSALQLKGMQDAMHSMAPTINVAAPPPVGGGSGLAWDKHDFDVTNNKGGDVDVEVNLAAPMSAAGGDDGDDLAAVVEALAQDQGPDPLDLVKMIMKSQGSDDSSEVARLRQAYQANADAQAQQMQTWMKGITDALSNLAKRQSAPPPPQSQYDIPAIIEALHPPPQPQQPPLDIAALMREMREAVDSGKQAPPCPPGVDPALLDMLRQAMEDLRDMHNDLAKAVAPPPPPPPPAAPAPAPSSASPSSSLSLMPPPPPPAGGAGGDQLTPDKLADLLKQLQTAAPLPLPPPRDTSAMDELKDLMAKQALLANKPIILPPPVVGMAERSASPVAPPPPPPPANAAATKDELLDLLKSHMPKPQRIPAPPVVTQKTAACCSAPPPEDRRPDEVRCPKVQGSPLPRCKRAPPKAQLKCKKFPCGKAVLDADGDVDVDATAQQEWEGGSPCEGDDCPHNTSSNFNPKMLLASLCRDGKCHDPTTSGKPPAMLPSQTGSL